jgi:NAD(P)-dependent dehydrogenase (short-subunit alcohol dehydrogenase family)
MTHVMRRVVQHRRPRHADKLEALAASIRDSGHEAKAFPADARDEDAMITLVETVEREAGPIDVAVFNIGANVRFAVTDTSVQVYRKVWEMAAFAGFLMGREVAIKRLLPLEETHLNEAQDESLKREAAALAQFQHPNVVTIYAFEADADGPYVVMEMVEGETLKDAVERAATLSYILAVAFAAYSINSIEFIQRFDPSVSFMDNFWPRIVVGSLPLGILGWSMKHSPFSYKRRLILWIVAFSAILNASA